MTGFDVELAELPATQAAVTDIEGELRSGEAQLAGAVDALLGGGWQGAAATAFGAAWAQWRAGAAEVLAGLTRTASLLGQTEAAYSGHDALNAATISRLEGGL